MSCEQLDAHLQALLDGELSAPDERRLREHLAECPGCRRDYEQLAELRLEAQRLPREVEPPRDLWPGIAARLSVRSGGRADRPAGRVPALPAWAWAAAAALAAAVGLLLFGRPGAPPSGIPADHRAEAPSAQQPSAVELAGLAELARSEDATLQSLVDLTTAHGRRRFDLDPFTRRALARDLRLLERSIGELRAALEDYPADRRLRLLLADRYRLESELARRLAEA